MTSERTTSSISIKTTRNDKANQTEMEMARPVRKLFRAVSVKQSRRTPVRLMNSGNESVALTAADGETYRPVKNNENAEVEGMPTRNPPNFPPRLSVARAITLTHMPIATNVNNKRNAKSSFDDNLDT